MHSSRGQDGASLAGTTLELTVARPLPSAHAWRAQCARRWNVDTPSPVSCSVPDLGPGKRIEISGRSRTGPARICDATVRALGV